MVPAHSTGIQRIVTMQTENLRLFNLAVEAYSLWLKIAAMPQDGRVPQIEAKVYARWERRQKAWADSRKGGLTF